MILLLLSDVGNARVIIEAVLLIETITLIGIYIYMPIIGLYKIINYLLLKIK